MRNSTKVRRVVNVAFNIGELHASAGRSIREGEEGGGGVERGYRAEGRSGSEQGWQWGNLVRSRYVEVEGVKGEGSGEFHAFVG